MVMTRVKSPAVLQDNAAIATNTIPITASPLGVGLGLVCALIVILSVPLKHPLEFLSLTFKAIFLMPPDESKVGIITGVFGG